MEGGHRTRQKINLCVYGVPPSPVYKGGEEGEGRPQGGRPKGGFLLLVGVGFPPFLVHVGEEGRRGEGEGKRGAPPPPQSNSDQPMGGRAASHFGPSLLSTKAHEGPILPPANACNSPVLRKIPEPLRTFPMYEYSLPIYRSLRFDHFETPRHVRDLIRDSEQTSEHQII